MPKIYQDVCPQCHSVFSGFSMSKVQNQAENCATRCSPADESNAPSLDEALDRARKELGDW